MEWTEKYDIHRLSLPIGDLVVKSTKDGYHVSAFGRGLKELSPDAEHGKERAVKLARRIIAETLEKL